MNLEASESAHSPEINLAPASIRLEFFRHDEKEKLPGDIRPDEEVKLTPDGRTHATEEGKQKNPQARAAIAFGSPRVRSSETALRHMLAEEEAVTPDMSYEEILAKIDEDLNADKKKGFSPKKKLVELQGLNFITRANPAYEKVYYDRYDSGKDGLVFMYKDSDALVKELKDPVSDSYSRSAGNYAEIVQKYVRMLPRWEQIVMQKPQEYAEYHNELQRFFGSHQTVVECFLMKVIEKTEGPAGVQRFIESLPNKNGFGYSEGYSVVIQEQHGEPLVSLSYKDKTWPVPPGMLDEMITERDALNKAIETDQRK